MKILKIFDHDRKHFLEISLLIILGLIFCRNFLTRLTFPAGMDSLVFASHVSFYAKDWYSLDIWRDTAIGTGAPFYFLIEVNFLAFINKFVNNVALVMNSFTILLVVGSGISIYIYSYSILKNRTAGFISAVLYVSNPFFSGIVAAYHLDVLIIYFLTPCILYIATKFTEKPSIRNTFLLAVIFSFLGFVRLHLLLVILPFLFIIFTYYFLKHKPELGYVRKFFIRGILSLLIFLVLISPTLMSLPSILSGAHIQFEGRNPFTYSLEIIYAFQGYNMPDGSGYMFWKWGYDYNTHPLSVSIILFLIPVFAFSSLLFLRSKFHNVAVLFGIIAIISIFLAKGPYPPFENIFFGLQENIPLIKSFLTAPYRFLAITWLSYSILVGILVVEIPVLSNDNRNIHHLGLLILFIFTGFLMNPFPFVEGYQITDLQKSETEPHVWLAENGNDSRYASVPYGQGRMFTQNNKGLNNDFGTNAYLYSRIPSFRFLGGSSDTSSYFYKYTQYLVKKEDRLLAKILGIYNVEYFVFQSYPFTQPAHEIYSNKYRFNYIQNDFFKNMNGLTKVYEGSEDPNYRIEIAQAWPNELGKMKEPPKLITMNITRTPEIYRNVYTLPLIFSPNNKVFLVGGLESFLKLAEIKSFNFGEWNILFADHLIEKIGKDAFVEQINNSGYIAFVNSEPLDLAILLSDAKWIKVNNLEEGSSGWKEDDGPIIEGFFVINKDIVSAREKEAKAIYMVDISNKSTYEIWIRALFHNKAGKLKIIARNELIGEVELNPSQKTGFKWIKVNDVRLDKGRYKLEIINDGRDNKLNGIVIVEKGGVEDTLNYVNELVDEKSIYLSDAEKHEKTESKGKNVIWYQNNKPIGNPEIRTEVENSVKYIDFKKIRPSKLVVNVTSAAPYTLVFSNSYHPLWRAYVNGKEYSSIPSYYFINSFQINETGEHEVVIEFIGQRIQNISLILSGLAYLGCFGYLFIDWRKEKGDKWAMNLKNKFLRIIRRD